MPNLILATSKFVRVQFWHVAKFVRTNFGVAKIRTGFKISSKFWQLQNLYAYFWHVAKFVRVQIRHCAKNVRVQIWQRAKNVLYILGNAL